MSKGKSKNRKSREKDENGNPKGGSIRRGGGCFFSKTN